MFRPNPKWLRISIVTISCLIVSVVALAVDREQNRLVSPENSVAAVPSDSVLADAAESVEPATPPGRLAVAVLWFEDRTADPQTSHWRYAVTGLLSAQLREAKAIRVRPAGAVDYAFRQLGLSKGDAVEPAQARKMGELIEAQRVIWGSYKTQNGKWQVSAYVLNVATGKASGELTAASADWFEVGDELTGRILEQLHIKPSAEELRKITERMTGSPLAYEWYSKAYAMQEEGKPISQQGEATRKAIAADPEFARAHLALASTLGSQGAFPEAEQAVRRALELKGDCADAHLVLGITLLFQKRMEEAERALREANRLDPDSAQPLVRLAELYGTKQNVERAIGFLSEAELLDPTNAAIHASLGWLYARRRDRDRAIAELKEAERLAPGGLERINAEQMISQTYEMMGEIPLAVEHYQRFVALARDQGVNPKMVERFEQQAQRLKATLTPTFVQASMPKVFTEQALKAELSNRLTEQELRMVIILWPAARRWDAGPGS